MTETLRWILIGLAVVLLLGIYLWGRRGQPHPDEPRVRRAEPRAHESAYDEFEVAPPEETPDDARLPEYDEPRGAAGREARRGARIEPTLGEENALAADASVTVELPAGPADAPTLSLSDSPPPRRIERRKIVALRLAAGQQRFGGEALRTAFDSQALVHGKYQVFHRLREDGSSVFSVASMVEPGTFDLDNMGQEDYPGVTLFAQLPGPLEGRETVDVLVACARNLQGSLGGSLQDERGIPLTAHRIERLREDAAEFERALSRARGTTAT